MNSPALADRHILAYGVLGLPLAFAALPLYMHVPHHYAAVSGLSLAWLGALLLGARLVDAAIDPWLGWLADRLPRRRLLALALPLFGGGFVLLLHPPATPLAAAGWLLGSLLLTYLGYSAATVAYQAWGADLADAAWLRTRLTAAREGFGLLGVVLAAALPTLLAAELDEGLRRLGWLLPPLMLVAMTIAFAGVGQRPAQRLSHRPLGPSLRRVLADPPFRRLLLVFVANGFAAALPATLFLFFVADVLGDAATSGLYLAIYFLAGAASLPAWLRLAARYGRVGSWLAAMALSVVAFAGAGLLDSGDRWPFALICLASGLALGADLALPAAMAADHGERLGQAGACFGVWNFVAKLNLALAAGLALPLLGALGYQPGGDAGRAVLTAAYAYWPLACKLLAAGLLWRWRHSLEREIPRCANG